MITIKIPSLLKNNDWVKKYWHYLGTSSTLVWNEGAYLYFDKDNMNWIRSGKISGPGFFILHTEHTKQADCKRDTSTFYNRYPTKEKVSITKASSGRKGFFENLK